MSKLYFGSKEVKQLMWRGKEVTAIYKGDKLIWSQGAPYLDVEHERIFIFDSVADNRILSNVKWSINL